MIDPTALLSDLQVLLKQLEADLLERSESAEIPDIAQTLHAEYERAKNAERTAQNYEDWRSDAITQAAAAWLLSCVFVRFLEDNRLIEPPKIAGSKERLQQARDEHELYFREHPTENDRDYLLAVFDNLATLPGTKDVFGEHNPIRERPSWLSGDAAGELLRFFQKIDADVGDLVHDFTDHDWDTRFLGDLYQDLSEAARKKYALLQTPEFVEEFILDRTLDPAIEEFGLEGFKMIDPACGSGHFLLGAFRRIEARWERSDPSAKAREIVQRTLDSIFGVDVNPFAVAIVRFRLLLAALRTCGVMKLANAPAFHMNLACGDSLYHGRQRQLSLGDDWSDEAHYFASEDAPTLRQMLRDGTYRCVVANPPYITPKDRAANQVYRKLYPKTCHRQYSLAVPFMERIYRLAVAGGFTGQITANSFMKREFGKKLIESFLPTVDLTHVIDTSGAYIPGHGTPTVILFGRNRKPVADTIRTVMGIRGEPSTPADPSRGLVWSAIINQIDQPGTQSEFVSTDDSQRQRFHSHPWSIGGGGAAELKEQLEAVSETNLESKTETISAGICITREDEAYWAPQPTLARRRISNEFRIDSVQGENVRDWMISGFGAAVFPYDSSLTPIDPSSGREIHRYLWPLRELLWRRKELGGDHRELGRTWWEWNRFLRHRFIVPLSIVYGEVATHNHFVLDRGGKVFNRTAPVIKLPADDTADDHLALLGLLNSSTACFWMKQVCHQKQMMGGDGIRIESKAKVPYAFNATALGKLPIPDAWLSGPLRERLLQLTRRMDQVTQEYSLLAAETVLLDGDMTRDAIRHRWMQSQADRQRLRAEQVFLQEQIDFTVYLMFDLVSEDLLGTTVEFSGEAISEGERPFCILDGTNEEGFAVPPSVPTAWPPSLQHMWQRRIDAIRNNRELRLIESSMYKRRWIGRQGLFNHQRSDDELGDAARAWLTNRLESYLDFDGRMNDEGRPTARLDIALTSVAKLADVARQDAEFMEVGEVYRDDSAFDVQRLVEELVQAEHVPLLPVLRYKPAGLRKRKEWEQTWELQRREDAGEDVGTIPVPPKYKSSDFISSGGARYWALRGKLDVPKERWVSFPHCEGPDGTLVIAWAGYDHLQLARAISAYFVDIQERLGGRDDPRLVPLLACIVELLPWLKQWHHDIDPDYNQRMDEVFEGFVTEEAKNLGMTIDEIKAWQPSKRVAKGQRGKGAKGREKETKGQSNKGAEDDQE